MHGALIDTGFLLALWNRRDIHHARAIQHAELVIQPAIICAPVLVELFYLLKERVNYNAAVMGFERLQAGGFRIEQLTSDDMSRMLEIMRQYPTSDFDYTDIANMAVAERLEVTTIYTFDKHYRYRYFHPKHTEYFTILP
jgi:uncharacterized protein